MEEKILEILKDVNEDILTYTGTDMIGDGVISSFDVISIISELEDTLDIEISAAYAVEENFANKDSIIKTVKEIMGE